MSITNDGGTLPAGNRRRGRQPGWYIPWLFVAFFGVVFSVNGVMVWVATSTYTGLQTEEYYRKGVKYNAALEGARAQAERGWKVEVSFRSPAERKGTIALSLRDRYGNLLTGSVVTAQLIRPTSAGHDVQLDVPYVGDGRYGADVELPLSGVWDLRIDIDHASGDWQNQQRVWVQ